MIRFWINVSSGYLGNIAYKGVETSPYQTRFKTLREISSSGGFGLLHD